MEAGQSVGGGNWGKFAVGRFTAAELAEPAHWPGGGPRLVLGRGWTVDHIWVLDLQTGEGAMFRPGGYAKADLDKHRIWVCPMFEPFLAWLYQQVTELAETWWEDLPRMVELPDAPFALYGYRRPGPAPDVTPS